MSKRQAPQADADRVMPHNLEAERAVLGACLLNRDAIEVAAGVLAEGDFYRQAHALIFGAVLVLHEKGGEADMVTVKAQLGPAIDEVGGPAYIAALVDGVPRSTNVEHYAGLVKAASLSRQQVRIAQKLSARAFDQDDVADVASEAGEALAALAGEAIEGGPVALREVVNSAIEAIERAHEPESGIVTGVATGFKRLDDLTAGLHPAQLVIVGARTSQGKTALALNILANVAKTGATALMFSIEMERLELVMRLLATESKVDSHRLRSGGKMLPADWGRLSHALGVLGGWKLFIDDSSEVGVREVMARARKVKAEHGLSLIVVDYVQLMTATGSRRYDNRTMEVGSFSRGLKRVAKKLQVPVVVLAQLSRGMEGGGAKGKPRPPQLSDLRESGDLEQDADVVVFIYRPDEDSDRGKLIVAKQRNGPKGEVEVYYDGPHVCFSDEPVAEAQGSMERSWQGE